MTAPSKWWAAASPSVGPSPTLAPGVLAQAALCVLCAALGHPAFTRPDEPAALSPVDGEVG